MTTLTIEPVNHSTDLFEIYPNQTEPRACYIALDLRTGRMSAEMDPEIGNAVPMDVWHGRVRRYHLPGPPVAAVANAVMEDMADHARTVLDHAEVVWDGSNNVVRTHERNCDDEWQCDCPIAVAERAIEAATSSVSEEEFVSWASAGDWYVDGVDEYVARVQAGESIEDVVDFMEQEIEEDDPNEVWVIAGIEAFLRRELEATQEGESS